jgi:hypothetical protein
VDVNSKELFTFSQNTHLRGNKFKLVKPKSVSVRDSNFYVNRIVNIWNSPPDSIVTADSLFNFTRRLNSFDFSNFIILYVVQRAYQRWLLSALHPFWHTMHVVFIFYSTALFSLLLVLSNKQTNKYPQLRCTSRETTIHTSNLLIFCVLLPTQKVFMLFTFLGCLHPQTFNFTVQ